MSEEKNEEKNEVKNGKKSLTSRIVKWLCIVVIALIVLFTVLIFILDRVVKTAGEAIATKMTGGETTIESVSIHPFRGVVTIDGVLLKNPVKNLEGKDTDFTNPEFFKLGQIHVDLSMSSLFSDTIVISEILITGPEITLEKTPFSQSNLDVIMEYLNQGKTDDDKEEKKEEKSTDGGKKLAINHLVLKDAKVYLSSIGLTRDITIANIELDESDLGKDGKGVSIPYVIAKVFQTLFLTIIDNIKDLGVALGDLGIKAGGALWDGAKSVGGAVIDGVKALNPFGN